MALRVCGRFLRRFSVLSAPLENAPSRLRAVLRAGAVRSDALNQPPASFVSSKAFLERLLRGRAVASSDVFDQASSSPLPTALPPDSAEQFSLLVKDPDQPENPKSLKVAIIGAPNAGKSTLTNQLLGRKLFAVSKKVHTTRTNALGVITEDDTQIILLDTPGLTTPDKVKRHQLENSLLVDPMKSLLEAELVVVLVDVSDKWTRTRLDFEVLKCLAQNSHIPAVLVLNKVDLLKNKSTLLDITAELTEGIVNGQRLRIRGAVRHLRKEEARQRPEQDPRTPEEDTQAETQLNAGAPKNLSREQLRALKQRKGWPHFKDVFMMCAMDGEDVETLKRYLTVEAKPGPWQYHSAVLTDQSPEDVCKNAIREKLLEYLPQEVPYMMTQHIQFWREAEDGKLDISVKLHVKKDSHMKMVIGPGGQLIARIAQEAGEDMMAIFLCEVRLKICATLKN